MSFITQLLFALSLSIADASGRCKWGDPVAGFIMGHNIAYFKNKTLAECQGECGKNGECKSIDFTAGSGECYLGSCRIGKQCTVTYDSEYKNYPCGADPVWFNLKGKEASQSSTAHGGAASRAIDGNSASRWHSGSCTHTHRGNSWWQVDMGEPVNVTDVKVTNRGDCCGQHLNGFTVKIDGKPCKTGVAIQQGQTKEVSCNGRGQVIRVEKMNDYVMICEFQLGLDPFFVTTMTTTAPRVWLTLKDKDVKQSSVVHGGSPFRAVDGNSNSRWHGGSCTHTHRNHPAWWEVDLGEKVEMTDVKLTNRGDCCGDQMSGFTLKLDGKPCQTGVSIAQGQTKQVQCKGTGQVVRIEVPKRTHLMLCEFGVGVSPAFAATMTTTPSPFWIPLGGAKATQVSTAHRGSASRAIDGNANSRWHGGSVTHTHRNNPSWWQVDLGEKMNVTKVKVTNRGDCCGSWMNGFKVKIDGKDCATGVSISQGQTKQVNCVGTGQVIRMEIPRAAYLMIAEFGVGVSPSFAAAKNLLPKDFTTTTILTTTVITTTMTTTKGPPTTTTVVTTTTIGVKQPSTSATCSPGICEKGEWKVFKGGQTEAQCKALCDSGRELVLENGVKEKVYYFRQNGHYHDVSSKTPNMERVVPQVMYHSTGGNFPGLTQRDHFYIQWSGFIEIKQPGKYTFTTQSDDGSFLDLNGKRVVDNPGWHGMRDANGDAILEAGKHAFVSEFFEGGGGAGMILFYKGPDTGDKRIVIPKNVFSFPGGGYKLKPGWQKASYYPGASCSGRNELPTQTGITLDDAKKWCSNSSSCVSFEKSPTPGKFQFSTSCTLAQTDGKTHNGWDLWVKSVYESTEDGKCVGYSHQGDSCLIYSECTTISQTTDNVCGSEMGWLAESFKDFKTCLYT